MGNYSEEEMDDLRYELEMRKRYEEENGIFTDDIIKADDVIGLTDEEVVDEAGLMGLI